MEPNVSYAKKGIGCLFYPVGAKNFCCFDSRIVEGVIQCDASWAVADFGAVEVHKTSYKIFQDQKAYPGSYYPRLMFVDVNDRILGRRMAVSMGAMRRSEEEGKAFVESVGDLDRVGVYLVRVVLPS